MNEESYGEGGGSGICKEGRGGDRGIEGDRVWVAARAAVGRGAARMAVAGGEMVDRRGGGRILSQLGRCNQQRTHGRGQRGILQISHKVGEGVGTG